MVCTRTALEIYQKDVIQKMEKKHTRLKEDFSSNISIKLC